MKTLKLTKLLVIVTISIFIVTCSKEDKIEGSKLTVGNDKGVVTPLDPWIEKNFIKPYNVNLIYKYDDTKIPQNNYATPVDYKKAVQMANILKYLFFEPFEKFAGKEFLKKFAPKEIVLMGSSVKNPNNTEKLGQAESGVRFTLFKINKMDVSNASGLYAQYFRTIYHEFAHILHQTEMFSPEFAKISAAEYVGGSWMSAWRNSSSAEVGFISDYSSDKVEEDFVELFAFYITQEPADWQARIDAAGGATGTEKGKAILETKIAIVKKYMKDVWNLDMDDLRDEILDRGSKINDINVIDVNSLN